MQHDMMRHPAPPPGADNVGDVLASIRRLIAQDEAGCRIPNQVLNTLPAQDLAPQIRVGPELSAAATVSATVTPLVLDSNALVPATDPTSEIGDAALQQPPQKTDDAVDPAMTAAQARVFSDWMKLPLTGATVPAFVVEPAAPAQDDSEGTPAAEAAAQPLLADEPPARIETFGPFYEEPITTVQMEETMLHVNNASVTPINPLAEAHAAADALNREAESHLFAPQDKGAQKGAHLRGMIRETIRQELQGEIGNRLSRNLQQMIRQEIELTLRQMCEQE